MKYIISVLFFTFLVFITISFINLRGSPYLEEIGARASNAIEYIKQWVQVKRHNIRMTHDLSRFRGPWQDKSEDDIVRRRPPVSLMLARVNLEQFLPSDFVKSLSQEDWDYIFDLIYEPVGEKTGDFTVKRYLTREEIEIELTSQFYYPFSHFQNQHWDRFWSVVLSQ